MVVSGSVDPQIHFHQAYLCDVLLRITHYLFQNLEFTEDVRKVGGDFLIPCSAVGML